MTTTATEAPRRVVALARARSDPLPWRVAPGPHVEAVEVIFGVPSGLLAADLRMARVERAAAAHESTVAPTISDTYTRLNPP